MSTTLIELAGRQAGRQAGRPARPKQTTRLERPAKQEEPIAVGSNSYLPDEGLHRDHVGGGPRARPGHCTSAGLTPAIIPNVDNSVV